MPMTPAVLVENLSKRYVIDKAPTETMLRDRLARLITRPFGRRRDEQDVVWALRDVTFRVDQGQVVGIIGRNGAGKSTLLKTLSKITYPTSGTVHVGGRVASLLEVGTGFHEELTGRENVYLNGSILGMKKREVDAKLDAIVSFAGVERFMDTPIKRYSSGMRLRLGFAVAAHLDPDILIIDEVLAVGDAAFQKKCLNTMEDLRSGGRTVLFVSHNMAAVENLCGRCIWIDEGRVRMDGDSRSVIHAYMSASAGADQGTPDLGAAKNRRGDGDVRYRGVEFLASDGRPQRVVRAGDPIVIRLRYHAERSVPYPSFGFRLYTEMGTLVTHTSTWHHGITIPRLEAGDGHVDLKIGCLNILPARYLLTLWITGVNGGRQVHDAVESGVILDVDVADVYESGKVLDSRHGILFWPQTWNLAGVNAGIEHPLPRSLAALRE